MGKPSWVDLLLALITGGMLWQPFRITGLLDGAAAAVIVVGIGCLFALPMLASFNRIFAESAVKRIVSKCAVLAGFLVLAIMMWMVIVGGLATIPVTSRS